MAQRYPDDYEVQVFYALTLQASASKTDMSYGNQLKSVAILEKLFEQNPQHPGVSHFIIHAYDFPPLAGPRHRSGQALRRHRAGGAARAPHASHIYSMVGMWEESIASNTSAMEIQPDYYHAADFTVYATCNWRRTSRRSPDRQGDCDAAARRPSGAASATSWRRR
jgi:hypothetical protein